jgi:hypothetical protein
MTELKEATSATMAPKDSLSAKLCQGNHGESSPSQQERITNRRAQIPKAYRGIYEKAMEGNSRKAAMHAFCLECCGYQIKEVFACTDLGCPLYPYRPKSRVSQEASESFPAEPESKKSTLGVSK